MPLPQAAHCMTLPSPVYDPPRLSVVRRSDVLSTRHDADFDRLAALVTRLLGVPTASITIVHPGGQSFVGSCGHRPGAERGTPLAESYCRHVVESGAPLVAPDARHHPLLRGNPAVANGAIAYAGVPLTVRGETMGTVCAIDVHPRKWSAADLDTLSAVGELAATALELELRRQEQGAPHMEREVEAPDAHAEKVDALGHLASGIAHDFNNVLSIILAHNGLAMGEADAGTELHEHLTEVENAARRAAGLTRQLLAFSRRSVPQVATVDVNAVIGGMVSMVSPLMRGVTISTSLDPQPALVHADPTHLEQVVLNLAVNARDAMPSGGNLQLSTSHRSIFADTGHAGELAPGRYVELAVTDSGCGIAPELRDRIFTPFFTTKAEGEGTGLGLATVQRLVKQMGGHIGVSSRDGEGATFTVLLPAA